MAAKKYLTTLNTRSFLYEETKQVASLLHQGKRHDEIAEIIWEKNLFQLTSEDRANRFYSEIQKRLEELDIYLFNQFLATDIPTSKAILFYALLKKDQLFYEWMREVVWVKFLVLDWQISREETEAFFELKAMQNKTVASWTPETKSLLIDSYHRVLHEVDMANVVDDVLQLQRLAINEDIRTYLIERKEIEIVEVMLGELIG
ncbi:DUF1819 family protein [Desemzia incerta]|uniref:DUF1819 family protein n=1 Tax=Desemzia incerta TaxID=82801 RepID=UPI001660DFE6|nr:DUF1819 family protein [Desemzia incerta]